MRTKIEQGRLSVNVVDLIDGLDEDGRQYVIDALSCQEQVIEYVVAQVIEGCTPQGSHGSRGWAAVPHSALDKARRYIAKNADLIRSEEIALLESHVARVTKDYQDTLAKLIDAERKLADRREIA